MEAERISCFLVPCFSNFAKTFRNHSVSLFWKSGIDPIYAADNTGVVWTRSLWVTKIVLKRYVSRKCKHGAILFQFQRLFSGRIKLGKCDTYIDRADFLSGFLTSVDRADD